MDPMDTQSFVIHASPVAFHDLYLASFDMLTTIALALFITFIWRRRKFNFRV